MRLFIDFGYFGDTYGVYSSHMVRLFCTGIFRMHIGRDSSIHWRAEFNLPSGISIGANTIIGNDAFWMDGINGWKPGENKIGYKELFSLRQASYYWQQRVDRRGSTHVHDGT